MLLVFSLFTSPPQLTTNENSSAAAARVTSRAVLRWFAVLLLLIVAAGSVAGVYLYSEKDTLLQTELLRQFHERAPGLKLRIGETRLRHAGEVVLSDVDLQDRVSGKTILLATEVRVSLDPAGLQKGRPPQIDAIRIDRAAALVTRFEDGTWNWQQYKVHTPKTDKPPVLPEITIDDLTVRLTLVHGGGIPPAQLDLQECRFQAVPASATSFDFDGGF